MTEEPKTGEDAADLLDRIPGAWGRVQDGIDDARAGRTVSLEPLFAPGTRIRFEGDEARVDGFDDARDRYYLEGADGTVFTAAREAVDRDAVEVT